MSLYGAVQYEGAVHATGNNFFIPNKVDSHKKSCLMSHTYVFFVKDCLSSVQCSNNCRYTEQRRLDHCTQTLCMHVSLK